ncbi:UDP-N-acetylgalactosamine-undecaprenyl-phosphate N-acetylgalactosaminephosphotransferase [bacterium BMS3Abin09]|nr:UDP-N-acetylgalactosamine-undecaprenyl-phosphate N-acetylgalactosaminephosphotransferase [bacterium BMS3Abin09]
MYKRTFVLIFGDALLAVLGVYAGFLIRTQGLPTIGGFIRPESSHYLTRTYPVSSFLLFIIVIIFSSFFVELYNQSRHLNKRDLMLRIMTGFLISFFLLSALQYMMPFAEYGRGVLALSIISFGIFQFFWHICHSALLKFLKLKQRVIILGAGSLAKTIGETITLMNNRNEVIGYIDCETVPVSVPLHQIIDNGSSIAEIVINNNANKLVISLSERRGVFPLKDVLNCKFSGIDVVDATSFYEELMGKLMIENTNPSAFIFDPSFRMTPYIYKIKRVADIVFSIIGLLISLPLMFLLAVCVKIDSPGPVFFKQTRVGLGEKNFTIYKLRTMRMDAEDGIGAVWAQADDPRITRFGKFLRRERFDELPQLYNVLRGDMSFIGPRPERPEFVRKLEEIIPYYSERHYVKPGITGWAQVKYRYGDSVESAIEKLKYDLFYIKHLSLFLEFQIFFETIRVILFGQGGR